MAIHITVPELGESVVEATVLRWLKQTGEPVAAGEVLVELETEKVNLQVSAEQGGILGRILHLAGDNVKIGEVLGEIQETADGQPPTAAGQASAAQGKRAADGDRESLRDQPPTAEKQTTPASHPPEHPDRETNGEPPRAAPEATPVARRYAQEYGVDLAQVPSASSDGRITKQDVQQYVERNKGEPTPAATQPLTAIGQQVTVTPQPLTTNPSEDRVHMSRRRQTIARRMVEAQHQAAILTTFNEIDMTEVIALRQRFRDPFKQRYGIGLGFTSFFVKVAIGALKDFPRLNAEVQGDEMILKHYYDIGIAVGAAEGLVVPVLREADRLSFVEIEKRIGEFAKKAEAGTLSIEDLRGGTFTITNGGVFGSLMSTPILNLPQVGILGLHKIEERPVAREDQVVIRPMMYVALSYDHRIVDGREAVQFLVRVKQLIEDPAALLLEG
ncbi:MAG: 2-oxoglutarate dehydrogenase complex dihydrolipoyllysine-residue succinyltransferase [Anaerolineae bacterium]